MQTNQSKAHTQPPPLLGSDTLGHYLPALITLRPGTIQLEIAPMPQSPLKLFKTSQS